MKTHAIFQQQGEGKSYWVLGDLYNFKVTGKETNGAFTVVDQQIKPKSGPPPHIHHKEDEAFYILDGTFSFLNGDQQINAEAGSFIYIPKGTLHTFQNISDREGRLLVVITPAGLEDFFYEIGVPVAGASSAPVPDQSTIEKVLKLASSYNMEIRL